MADASGLNSQLGVKAESTFGTYNTVDRFFEFTEESMSLTINRTESKGLRAGRRTKHRWAPTTQSVSGDISMELAPENTGILFLHAIGAVSTTGSSPYEHEFTPGTLKGKSLSVQFNKPDINGTDRVFTYLGCKVADWTISASVGEYAMLRLGLYGTDEVTSESLETASYDANWEPFVFTNGSLTVAGTEICVKSLTMDGNNGLKTDRHFMCGGSGAAAKPKEPLESSFRQYSGSFTADFQDLTNYNRFVNGTEAALVLTFDRPGDDRSLVITQNVRFDGDTPNVKGDDLLEQTFNYVAISNTSDADAFTAVLENGDATP